MTPAKSTPSNLALAIARGLVRTGRAKDSAQATDGYLHLRGIRGDDFWVAFDGRRILRGPRLALADELQPGFIDAMARAGVAGA